MNRSLDFYEYAALIIPGSVLMIGLFWLLPETGSSVGQDGVTFGEFGLFIIIAYAVGQLIQGIGNWIEWLLWKPWGGLPSRRILAGELLSTEQHERLVEALRGDGTLTGAPTRSEAECLVTVREVYSVVADAGQAARVDTFNGNYGLLRGLAASMLLLLATAIATAKGVYVVGALGGLLLLALQRMHRFGKHYAIELFVQYLLVSRKRSGAT